MKVISRSLIERARRRKHQGGAALVEYAVLLFAVLICSAAAIKAIGPSVACAGANATDSLIGGLGGGGCGGATASAGRAAGAATTSSVGATGSPGANDSAAGGADESGESAEESGGTSLVASSLTYDDGAGGFMGGSGSSLRMAGGGSAGNGGSGSGSAPQSGLGFAAVGGASGGGASGGGASGGGGGGGDASSAANSNTSFASQVAGTTPQQIDRTLAKLSLDVYGDKNAKNQKGADGFRPLTAEQLADAGITQSMLQDKNSGFVADVYTNGKGDYVVAYRGTMVETVSGWGTDVAQGAGIGTTQFAEGARLAAAAKAAFGNNLVFTGHSLGGSLAASSAAATGLTAVTFNAAGLNDNTLVGDGVNPAAERAQANNGQVRRYEVQGEILTGLQEAPGSVMPQALGRRIEIQDPNSRLTASDLKKSSFFDPWPAFNRSADLHSQYLQGMDAHPVIYRDASGKPATYEFKHPKHPS